MAVLLGPGLAVFVVVLALCVLMRAAGRRRRGAAAGRFGLLVPVGRILPWDRADAARDALAAAGVRATVARAGRGFDADGREWAAEAAYVLVFPADVDLAERVLAGSPHAA